jgi:hypothetical protein
VLLSNDRGPSLHDQAPTLRKGRFSFHEQVSFIKNTDFATLLTSAECYSYFVRAVP